MITNIKQEAPERALGSMKGHEGYTYSDFCSSCVEGETELDCAKVFALYGRSQVNDAGSKAPGALRSKRKRGDELEGGGTRGDCSTRVALGDFDSPQPTLDLPDIVSIRHVAEAREFQQVSIMRCWTPNSNALSSGYTCGYQFDYDKSLPCALCGVLHHGNNVWVMYASDGRRFIRGYSANCPRTVEMDLGETSLALWQERFETEMCTRISDEREKAVVARLVNLDLPMIALSIRAHSDGSDQGNPRVLSCRWREGFGNYARKHGGKSPPAPIASRVKEALVVAFNNPIKVYYLLDPFNAGLILKSPSPWLEKSLEIFARVDPESFDL